MKKKLKDSNIFPIIFIGASILALAVLILFIILNAKPRKSASDGLIDNSQPAAQDGLIEIDSYVSKEPALSDYIKSPVISGDDPFVGNENAPVKIVIFSDYECGYCQKQEQILEKIYERHNDNVVLIWKDYPDSKLSANSYKAAIAARCANEQNKFREYRSELFSGDINKLTEEDYIKIAGKLNLDLNQYVNCLKSGEIQDNINDNIAEANALNITGVPYIYINDYEVMGQADEEYIENIIKAEQSKN